MNNKLPKIFANKIEKKVNNNKQVYVSENKKDESEKTKDQLKRHPYEKTINQKINEILKSNNYIYKIPVKIELNNGKIITNIIGKNKKNIITINNELINIEEIKNIELYKKNE